jgi:quercetin dioxygenase-like cupin family protein
MRACLVSAMLIAQATAEPITRLLLLENDTVMVARLSFPAGTGEQVHTHPFSAAVVYLTPAEVETRIGTAATTARRKPGEVDFIAADMPHAATNVGHEPFDVVTIALKPARKRGGDQPPTAARPGIWRTQTLDNPDVRVTRALFEPGAREPVHTHPFDMVIVQLAGGRMEVVVGQDRTVRDYFIGEAVFLPRDVPHSVANVDTHVVEIVSVAIR